MNNKKVVILFSVLIVPLFIFFISLFPFMKEESMVDIEKDGKIMLNIDVITNGTGFIDLIGQQIRTEDVSTVFTLEGYYIGNYLKDEFIDENGKTLMRIGSSMDPEDGVIEGFMIEKIENDKPLVYIFLDEDWKKQVKDTKILWGNSWAFNKSFEFKSIEKGIYLEVIEDDRSRFSKDYGMSFYGVIVGDITQEDTENKTLIMLT